MGKNNKSKPIAFRVRQATYCEIERLIKESPAQPTESVGQYCENEIERFVWRHKKVTK